MRVPVEMGSEWIACEMRRIQSGVVDGVGGVGRGIEETGEGARGVPEVMRCVLVIRDQRKPR